MVRPAVSHDLDMTIAAQPVEMSLPQSMPMPMPLPMPASPQQPEFPSSDPHIRSRPLPGVRCPTCAANGKESWVLPGRACNTCGTPCF